MESLTEKQKHQIAMLLYDFGFQYSDFREGMTKASKVSSLCTVLLSLFAQFCEEESVDPEEVHEMVSYVFRVHLNGYEEDVPVM